MFDVPSFFCISLSFIPFKFLDFLILSIFAKHIWNFQTSLPIPYKHFVCSKVGLHTVQNRFQSWGPCCLDMTMCLPTALPLVTVSHQQMIFVQGRKAGHWSQELLFLSVGYPFIELCPHLLDLDKCLKSMQSCFEKGDIPKTSKLVWCTGLAKCLFLSLPLQNHSRSYSLPKSSVCYVSERHILWYWKSFFSSLNHEQSMKNPLQSILVAFVLIFLLK